MPIEIQHVPVSMEGWHEEQQAWNDRSNFFVNMHSREDRMAQVRDFVKFVKTEGLLPASGGKTVDIGCATGDYSLALAANGYDATGIDLSNGMIEGAREIAEATGVELSLYVAPWSEITRQELGWNQTFDLAYSTFCPVMFEPDNIKAMHKSSRNKCLWVAFSERSDKMVDMLSEHFFGKDAFPWEGSINQCLDTIHEIGKDVKVTYKTVPETEVFDLDAAVDYFAMRLHRESWGPIDTMKDEIHSIVAPLAVDGKITNETTDKVAWVSWSVQ